MYNAERWLQERMPARNELDVTGLVLVSSAVDVRSAVGSLFSSLWPGFDHARLRQSFELFDDLFSGRTPGYLPLDTPYHDTQHSLDVTLCAARMIAGHELTASQADKLGPDRALLILVCALFHDAGYLRRTRESAIDHGARLTRIHVSRSATVLAEVLAQIGLHHQIAWAELLVHFTGYERPLEDLVLPDARDQVAGRILGTADLVAQMADRCYLEKVRDRLFSEFQIAGMAGVLAAANGRGPATALDLLRTTPGFVTAAFSSRLDANFQQAYRWLNPVMDNGNPYLLSIKRQVAHLERVIESGQWRLLRRQVPYSGMGSAGPGARVSVQPQVHAGAVVGSRAEPSQGPRLVVSR